MVTPIASGLGITRERMQRRSAAVIGHADKIRARRLDIRNANRITRGVWRGSRAASGAVRARRSARAA